MPMELPVGAVCPFAGQVDPVSGDPNEVWPASCGAQRPSPAKPAGAPLNHLEAQGWMLCDGRPLPIDGYPELFAVIGTLYGKGDQASVPSFCIPDYRGVFLRGFDAGAGMDPDAAERTSPTGQHVENVVGSLQCDALQTHTHYYERVELSGVSQPGQAAGMSATSQPTTAPDAPARVTSETRPRNVAVNYIIRFR